MLNDMPTTATPEGSPDELRLGRRLAERPPVRRAHGYPWQLWEDEEWWLIKRGEQFQCSLAGMRSALRSHAVRRGAKVDVVLRPDDRSVPAGREHLYIAFRFINPSG
jgi:hypothetical protein